MRNRPAAGGTSPRFPRSEGEADGTPLRPGRPGWFARIDGFILGMYHTGCVQSVIVHTAILLLLALVAVRVDTVRSPITMAVAFAPGTPEPPSMESLPELTIHEPPPEGGLQETPEASRFEPPAAVVDIGTAVEAVELEGPVGPAFSTDDVDLTRVVAVGLSTSAVSATSGEHIGIGRGAAGHGAAGRGAGTGSGGGIDGELGRRLRAAGAKTGDVQVSIRWDNQNDIDVHVLVEPPTLGQPSMINWMGRFGRCGGVLDVDANAMGGLLTATPVENIFWAKGRAPFGRYTVMVHHFRSWTGQLSTPVEVAVLVDGQVHRFHPTVTYGGPPTVVTTFVRQLPGGLPPNPSTAGTMGRVDVGSSRPFQ